ncbi:MAG: Hsp20/alpha crystallin family protein [Spirochaetes bacterium]|nr:Hsp20/alpha crystallin family protein [Spirochaetota bacterium]MBU0954983.1 Hsp20/alpha crystallin family protein [Spirochaetota bacterium]
MNTVMTYNPETVLSVFDDWDKLVDNFFVNSNSLRGVSPLVDIRETKDEYFLEAELPGLSDKDVDIKVQDRVLTIASLNDNKEAKSAEVRWLVRERRSFSFRRSFTLPRNADVDNINATFKDGLLTITMPKSPEAKERVISINRA